MRAVLRAFRRPVGAVAGGWLLAMVFVAVFAAWLTPYDYDIQALKEAYQPPSAAHWLGKVSIWGCVMRVSLQKY